MSSASANQLHLLDVLKAGKWSHSLFATYTLSLGFFEAAPLPALRRAGANDIRILSDLSGVVGALGEAGARGIGRSYAVDPVEVRNGCFHPKFTLLQGDAGLRLIIGSGNLTFAGWGRNLEIFEVLSPESAPLAFTDMGDFLEALATSPRIQMPAPAVLERWVDVLQDRHTPSEGELRLIHSVERPIAEQLIELAGENGGAVKLVVASPYFGHARAVQELAAALALESVGVHVSSALALGGTHYDFEQETGAQPIVIEILDEGSRQRPLHGKLIEIECRDAVLTVSGSANASGPGLSRSQNVELCVVRRHSRRLLTRPFSGELPYLPQRQASEECAGHGVLVVSLIGQTLSGMVMGREAVGTWTARIDASGTFHDVGQIEVGDDRRFTIDISNADKIVLGTRRAICSLSRGTERLSGFVTFPDLLELSRRWGAGATSIMRVAGGSADDEDLAGVLEYFARHPAETATAWGGPPASDRRELASEEDRLVPLSQLDTMPRAQAPEVQTWGSGRNAIDRLIAVLRRALLNGAPGAAQDAGGDANEGEHEGGPTTRQSKGPPAERTERVFDQLKDVLAARVPADPATELHRLAEIGLFVLARRPDAGRFQEFVSWWSSLATTYLRSDPEQHELRSLATSFLLIDGLSRRSPRRARHGLAVVIGDVDDAIREHSARLPKILSGLIEQATAGETALQAFASEVLRERSYAEELPVLLEALRTGAPLPLLQNLDREPEMAAVRKSIETGEIDEIIIAYPIDAACPKCSIGLPQADLARLHTIGLVKAQNCCSRIVVFDRNS